MQISSDVRCAWRSGHHPGACIMVAPHQNTPVAMKDCVLGGRIAATSKDTGKSALSLIRGTLY